MRILVAQNVYSDVPGGMSRIMRFIHDRIAAKGHTVDYFCSEHAPSWLTSRWRRIGFPVLAFGRARSGHPESGAYDIVNVHEASGLALCLAGGLLIHAKIVVTSHGLERRAWELALEEQHLGRSGPSRKERLTYPLVYGWQANYSLRHADHVFCLNQQDREYLSSVMGVALDRSTRIFPGADGIYAATACDGRYTRPAQQVLFAATWRKNKGIEDFVPAFTAVARANPEIRLVVLGGGLPESTIKSQFASDVRSRVSCVQTSGDEENATVYESSDIFVLPSLFEGTPLALIEAMASGLPIVTTNVCGMRDIIEDGRNGLLVPTRSPEVIAGAIRALISDPLLRIKLGCAARADAIQRYTWERAAETVCQAYMRILDQGGT